MTQAESYGFFFTYDYEPRMEMLTALREVIGGFFKEKSTFTFDQIPHSTSKLAKAPEEMFFLVGSWKIPDRFTGRGKQSGRRYVNPYAEDRHRYSDCVVRCACGAYVDDRQVPLSDEDPVFDHAPDCTVDYREEARQKLEGKRMKVLVLGANLWLDAEQVAQRLGYKNPGSVRNFASRAGLSWRELRKVGRRRTIKTWDILRDRGYSLSEIGAAWDVPRSTVSSYLNGSARGVG